MTILAPSPETQFTPTTDYTYARPHRLGEAAIMPGRHRAPEERVDVPVSYSDGVIGRHRRTAGRLAYAAARETGDPELIKTADRLVRREDGGDPTATADAETLKYLINLAKTQPNPTMPTLANMQDLMMPHSPQVSTSEVLRAHETAQGTLSETTLTPEDFYQGPGSVHTLHQAGTRDLNLPTDARDHFDEPTSHSSTRH